MINSQEALRIGLVNKIISPEKLMDESINFCKELQKNGPASISNSLKCINDSYDYSLEDGLETNWKHLVIHLVLKKPMKVY